MPSSPGPKTVCTKRRWARSSRAPLLLAALLATSACSVERIATKTLGDTLLAGGSIFESDDDPALIAEALPLALKIIESLAAQQPENERLMLEAARGFTLYTYIAVGLEEERVRLDDIETARRLRRRARHLYLRAHRYALRALEIEVPGVGARLSRDPAGTAAALAGDGRVGVETLYWNAVTLGLAISSARNDPALLARLPEVEGLLGSALAIDESWDRGTLHELALTLAAESPSAASPDALERHYSRALELSHGERASLFVAYAEAEALRKQDRDQFVGLLERALDVDVDRDPQHRLLNVIAQQRAELLLERVDQLFL